MATRMAVAVAVAAAFAAAFACSATGCGRRDSYRWARIVMMAPEPVMTERRVGWSAEEVWSRWTAETAV